jgi:hypothetical protein
MKLFILIAVSAFFLSGCGPENNSIVGKWRFEKIVVKEGNIDPEFLRVRQVVTSRVIYQFDADGKVRLSILGDYKNSTYRLTNDSKYLAVADFGPPTEIVSIDSHEMIWSSVEAGAKMWTYWQRAY